VDQLIGPENNFGPPPGDERERAMPLGTYSAVYDEEGNVLFKRVFGGDAETAIPNFNVETLTEQPQTIKSSGVAYRAAARTLESGERIVVALPTTENSEALNRLLMVEAIVVMLVLVLLGAAAWVLVGIGLRPLDRMGETADAIAGGDLTHRVEPATEESEIGRLGLALNRMLDRLESAFAEREASEGRLRQFLSDASHELRTPLVSIRGYAELHRLGATPEPEEVERSMARIEQEAERMGVLVEDMLTLARLDETHEKSFAPVDLSQIARDAIDDARVSSGERQISLQCDDDLIVNGDAHQLQQVFANLLRNAVVHTPPDTAIDVRVVRSGDQALVEVRDHGPGLPEGVGDEIFERFWRSETGRERGKAGAGLGLSIVHGIVSAHDGRVKASNAQPGVEFSVWLPLSTLS
jgi:two-component system OmpR family sensor kinase